MICVHPPTGAALNRAEHPLFLLLPSDIRLRLCTEDYLKLEIAMHYLFLNACYLTPAATNGLFLVVAIATGWALLRRSNCATVLAAMAACALIVAAFTPIGDWLARPLETRFSQWRQSPHNTPDGIIVIGGESGERISALAELSSRYPQARLVYSGTDINDSEFSELLKIFFRRGGDPKRITFESRSRNTYENAIYSADLIRPKMGQRWLLVTFSLHMPRAIGTFRHAGFKIEAYPVDPHSPFIAGSPALIRFDSVVREWTGLLAYRLMGRTDALFPEP
jgi:uncharacterized SAM-binding protein YcdF (DUF218 family)